MTNWLRPLLLMFYAPRRGMSEVRDRAPLAGAMLLALLAQLGFIAYTLWQFISPAFLMGAPSVALFVLFRWVLLPILLIAVVFVPALILLANLFERRGSYGLVLQQEYAPLTAATLYAWAAANLTGLPLAWLARTSGFEAEFFTQFRLALDARVAQGDTSPEMALPLYAPFWQTVTFAAMLLLPFFVFWAVRAVSSVFRLSTLRSTLVTLLGLVFMFIVGPVLARVFGMFLGAPFWLIFLLIMMRGYFTDVTRNQRARASFKQNLEAATLNPADASAHYNLGLIHQGRGELDEARKRFERAIEIDVDELDAHYQLGRIAREQGRLSDAINHFGEVVARDPAHAQHEIWRETGATYLAAGQFEDAREALSRFLENRASDPQGLYLMGRALAGLGRQREAADSMQACIEAVKTAPAYKYRTEKRWLNEAQQFLRSQA
ncbi:MAG TPA: tetratricopeptide repeat protein [Pyrinomonadaceae bacterium]|nr:tetratricopeptide repeat protein [Pyrinomonadaceae bacterium]